jgi:hypothetical protein
MDYGTVPAVSRDRARLKEKGLENQGLRPGPG